jgi:hypothetical protein
MIRNQNQQLIFIFFLTLVFGFMLASVVRNNDEFLFFSGILGSMFQLYNYPLYEDKSLLRRYLVSDLAFLAISLFVGKHAFSLQFPIITILFVLMARAIFFRWQGVYPEDKNLPQKWKLWLYNSFIYLFVLGIWILLILLYLDKGIK